MQKTTISELTDSAEIGIGTFYQFYDSKEDLYVDIIGHYIKELIPWFLRESVQKHDDPERAIVALLDVTLDGFELNPLLRRVLAEGEVGYLRDSVPDEKLTEKRAYTMGYFLPYIKNWYDEGEVASPDPETVAETIHSVSRIALQRKRIDEERYLKDRDTLIAAVAAELTREADSLESSDE